MYTFTKKTVRDVAVHDKRILLRADFNVPLNEDGTISSDYRIVQAVPTIKYLLERRCEVVIVSHLGRPKGEVNTAFTLAPVATRLAELLETPVRFVEDCCGDIARQALKSKQPATVTLLENVRFYAGEEANDQEFAQRLKNVIKPDYVVHDEFGVIHRAHASTEGISHLVPSVAGLLLEKEVTILSGAIEDPQKPLVAVLGGAKISDKLPLVERFLDTADSVLVGGAMANNFIAQQGYTIGKSLVDPDGADDVAHIVAAAKPDQLYTPQDVAVGESISKEATRKDVGIDGVGETDSILDLGYETMRQYCSIVSSARTVIWNGNLGMTELPQFARASEALAQTLADNYEHVECIIGGGDTAEFVLDWIMKNPEAKFKHISTGGGASLELMSGLKLPGIEALLDK